MEMFLTVMVTLALWMTVEVASVYFLFKYRPNLKTRLLKVLSRQLFDTTQLVKTERFEYHVDAIYDRLIKLEVKSANITSQLDTKVSKGTLETVITDHADKTARNLDALVNNLVDKRVESHMSGLEKSVEKLMVGVSKVMKKARHSLASNKGANILRIKRDDRGRFAATRKLLKD